MRHHFAIQGSTSVPFHFATLLQMNPGVRHLFGALGNMGFWHISDPPMLLSIFLCSLVAAKWFSLFWSSLKKMLFCTSVFCQHAQTLSCNFWWQSSVKHLLRQHLRAQALASDKSVLAQILVKHLPRAAESTRFNLRWVFADSDIKSIQKFG
jgi:hypothetical protein